MAHECSSELRVRYAETDQMGVVYHANYLVWCEVGRTDFIRMLGTPYAELERSGIQLAVCDVAMRFHRPARYDDAIRVTTVLTEVRSRTMTFAYRITLADRDSLLVSASTTLVSLDSTGRPVTIPQALRDVLRPAVMPSDTALRRNA